MRNHRLLVEIAALVGLAVVVGGLFVEDRSEAQDPKSSPLGPYGVLNTYCGDERIPANGATILWIGCFSLSAGHSATGTFSNHQVEVAIDADGNEAFTVDGTTVKTTYDPQRHIRETNVPYVHVGGVAGYSICADVGPGRCPSSTNVFSRNTDKSVLFMVSECFPPQYRMCVLTQKNWDYEKSHQH
jgi:hypothetical protein